jgi:hypothetical protein
VRDWQIQTPQWSLAKSFDTHGPIGPWIVTADELDDPHMLGHPHLRQRRAAPAVQHGPADLRLLPAGRDPLAGVHAGAGDVIATGTPSGIAARWRAAVAEARRPRAGRDRRLGAIENEVVQEDAATGARRLRREMSDLDADVLIVGYGPVGQTLARCSRRGPFRGRLRALRGLYDLPRAVYFDDEIMQVWQSLRA